MKKTKKIIGSFMAVMMLVMSMGITCFADTLANEDGANTTETKVSLTQAATEYDFEVTEEILMSAEANSVDATVDSFTIKNNAVAGQISYTIENEAASGWEMKAFDTDWANEAVNEKAYGLQADSEFDMSTGAYTPDENVLTADGGEKTNAFSGKVATTTAEREAVQVGTITATVDWVTEAE